MTLAQVASPVAIDRGVVQSDRRGRCGARPHRRPAPCFCLLDASCSGPGPVGRAIGAMPGRWSRILWLACCRGP